MALRSPRRSVCARASLRAGPSRALPRATAALALLAVLAPAGTGQSFNVDVGANVVYGLPSSLYGGGAGQPGHWNAWGGSAPLGLVAIDGAATPAAAQYLWNVTWSEFEGDIPGSSGGDERLMDDRRQSASTFGAIEEIRVSGLWNGDYVVVTYAFGTSSAYQTRVRVHGSPDPSVVLGFGTFPGGHAPGVTFAQHRVAVSNGQLTIEVDTATNFFSTFNGFQLRFAGAPPVAYCTAKQNSLGCTPALAATGTPSASAGSGCVISCSNVLNAKPGLLLVTTGGRAATPFLGGTLCLAPPIQRSPGVHSGGSAPPAVDCTGVWQLDFNAYASGALGGNPAPALLQPGAVIDVQWWGRDPGFAAPNNVALSSGLELVQGY